MITQLQKMWLTTRGGRTEYDIFFVDGNLCLYMRSKREDVIVVIPSDIFIDLYINSEGHVASR